MFGLTLPRKRKWARRGAAVADFVVGFLVAAVGLLLVVFLRTVCGTVAFFRSVRARPRELGERDEASSRMFSSATTTVQESSAVSESQAEAVEALVALGIPRRAASAKVSAASTEAAALSTEELLTKALALPSRRDAGAGSCSHGGM